ncbi:hypothetical protein E4656_08165 [Natronospirillum operosum]|uniref:HemY N-terminal domain-containing protein n=1 Tax=Natronospirillum operosum TaxID=2759953 RepID=A0A4Z0WFR6_9GAMM|nr:heme biosynthesis HemY N-terminal domain-containing protein [Natronospirillum operosum]TGG94136.1 hypothetical protein E4656_08165 [Natronospirillum operosum]
MITLSRIIWPLVIIAIGGLLGWLMRQDPGYLLLAWGDHAVEMSIWVALAIVLLALLGMMFVRTLIRGVIHLRPNRHQRGVQKLEKGILAFLELRLPRAKRHLTAGEADSPLPWVNQLLLARIAQTEKDYPTVASWLDKATQEHPHMDLASGLLLVLSAYESRQLDLALAHAKRLEQNHPGNPFVLRLLRDIHVRLQDWQSLLELQPRLIKTGRRKPERWQCDMVAGLMEEAPANAGQKLQKWWKQLTTSQQSDPDLRYWYLRALVKLERPHIALQAIEHALSQHWDSRLLTLYSQLDTPARERLRQAEAWLQKQPRDALFMLALGRLCLQEGLWGKAQDYFADGLRLEPLPELELELARLEAALGQNQQSQERLARVSAQLLRLPPLPLPEKPARTEYEKAQAVAAPTDH